MRYLTNSLGKCFGTEKELDTYQIRNHNHKFDIVIDSDKYLLSIDKQFITIQHHLNNSKYRNKYFISKKRYKTAKHANISDSLWTLWVFSHEIIDQPEEMVLHLTKDFFVKKKNYNFNI